MSAEDGVTTLARACDSLDEYLALGNEVERLVAPGPEARFVRRPGAPSIWDANHVSGARGDGADVDTLLARAAEHYAGFPQLCFQCDPLTPTALEARLVLDGYSLHAELELLLEGELEARPGACQIRLAERDEDWERIVELSRIDHSEQGRRAERPPFSEQLTRDLVGGRRAKGPSVRTWLARADGVACAFLSSWPGGNGVGKVEDLFTRPDFRHRGIATALIVHAVEDARARGAGPVLIGADPNDTPRHMYAQIGFRPFLMRRRYVKGASGR